MKKKTIIFLKLFLGIFIFVLLIYKVGLKDVFITISSTKIYYLPLVVILYLFSMFIGSVGIKIFTDLFKKIDVWLFYKYYLISQSLSLLTPARIGQFFIVHPLKKEGVSLGRSTSILLVDKFITLIVVFIFLIFGFFWFLSLENALFLIFISVLGGLFMLFLFLSNKGRGFIKKWILRKYASKFEGFSKTLNFIIKKNKSLVLLNLIITLLRWVTVSIWVYLIFLSLNQLVSLWSILVITAIEFIVSLLPFTLAGLGIREGTGLYLFVMLGVPAPIVLSRYVIGIIIRYVTAGLVLLFIKTSCNTNKFK